MPAETGGHSFSAMRANVPAIPEDQQAVAL